MIDFDAIICKYYDRNSVLYNLLITHSTQVANKAVAIAKRLDQNIDLDFLFEAAMLHDIGIYKTHAPSIYCNGTAKYITHGIIGKEILDNMGLHAHALVCLRHTGAGITANEIISQNLPLPHIDMLPISIEEKIICYADKFFSKSDPLREKNIDEIRSELARFGTASMEQFNLLYVLFELSILVKKSDK